MNRVSVVENDVSPKMKIYTTQIIYLVLTVYKSCIIINT